MIALLASMVDIFETSTDEAVCRALARGFRLFVSSDHGSQSVAEQHVRALVAGLVEQVQVSSWRVFVCSLVVLSFLSVAADHVVLGAHFCLQHRRLRKRLIPKVLNVRRAVALLSVWCLVCCHACYNVTAKQAAHDLDVRFATALMRLQQILEAFPGTLSMNDSVMVC